MDYFHFFSFRGLTLRKFSGIFVSVKCSDSEMDLDIEKRVKK